MSQEAKRSTLVEPTPPATRPAPAPEGASPSTQAPQARRPTAKAPADAKAKDKATAKPKVKATDETAEITGSPDAKAAEKAPRRRTTARKERSPAQDEAAPTSPASPTSPAATAATSNKPDPALAKGGPADGQDKPPRRSAARTRAPRPASDPPSDPPSPSTGQDAGHLTSPPGLTEGREVQENPNPSSPPEQAADSRRERDKDRQAPPRRDGEEGRRSGGRDRGRRNRRDGRDQRSSSRGDSRDSRDSRNPRPEERSRRGRERNPRAQDQSPKQQPADEGSDRDTDAELASAPQVACEGLLEVTAKGFGFLRSPKNGYQNGTDDVFVAPEVIRAHGLRQGTYLKGFARLGRRGPQLTQIDEANGQPGDAYLSMHFFDELTAINPKKRYALETNKKRFTTRVIDMMAPIGRGQRGLIVAPPRSGKTTLLQHIAEGMAHNYPDVHLMLLLIDERPEEVTELSRELPSAEIFASSNDAQSRQHTRIAELAIERAKRLVEAGQDVFMLLDSITRLARAFNRASDGRNTGSGGVDASALQMARRLFAAARNTREAGSLTIIGTALIETGSKGDEVIFQEFKGTGNMELVLDRQIAQNYIYPAVDIFRSGTRREELLLASHQIDKIYKIRRGLAGHKPIEAIERLLHVMSKFESNAQMLIEIPA